MPGAFVDSNIWIYAISATEPQKKLKAERLVGSQAQIFISTQVVNEVLANMIRKDGATDQFLSTVVENLHNRCTVLQIALDTYRKALELRSRFRFSFWDSLIVAAALGAGCEILYSEDLQHGQIIENLTIKNPFHVSA